MKTKSTMLLDRLLSRAVVTMPRMDARQWTPEEDAYVRENLGILTEEEMAKHLNRTKVAVHLRWKRDLYLTAPSKRDDVLTGMKAAKILNVDSHKISSWVDIGMIPGSLMPGDRKIRLISKTSFLVWACNPDNWVYFDIKKVADPHLKRLLKLRAKRWGDEWWTTRQVADYHGVDTGDVKRYIKAGWIKSFRLPVSLGGRHQDRKWSNHFIKKSEALRVKFFSVGNKHSQFTQRADAWLLKARDELNMTFVDIGKTMRIGKVKSSKYGGGTNTVIAYRYHQLKADQKGKGKKS